ncbi:MAG: Fur family ferric uptake transcriptional regulator [Sphingobacteriales bacterium]|jgi:Fur family ferric uptake transcriptional regulator
MEEEVLSEKEIAFLKIRDLFANYMESKAMRKTPERFAILKEIYLSEHHFDVESLYLLMKNKNYRVSRATIYNTLDLLVESNLVSKHQFGNNVAQYEKSYGFKQHDHAICTNCGKVLEFCDPRIQNIQKMVEEIYGFSIHSHSLNFYGACNSKTCIKKK